MRESGQVDKGFGEWVVVEEKGDKGDGLGEFSVKWQVAFLQRWRFGVGKETFPNQGWFFELFLKQKEQLQLLSCPYADD